MLTDLDFGPKARVNFRPYLSAKNKNWNEGWQGFASAAAFTVSAVEAYLLNGPQALFKNKSQFEIISDREIRRKYAEFLKSYPNESEEDRAYRIAYFHNAGSNPSSLGAAKQFDYATKLVEKWNNEKLAPGQSVPCAAISTPRFKLDPVQPQRNPIPTP